MNRPQKISVGDIDTPLAEFLKDCQDNKPTSRVYNIFDRARDVPQDSANSSNVSESPLDLLSTKEAYEIWVNVPGFDKNCLDVTIKDSVLTISGKNPVVFKPSKLTISRRQSPSSFSYQLKLNTRVDTNKTETSLIAGVLYVKLYKVHIK